MTARAFWVAVLALSVVALATLLAAPGPLPVDAGEERSPIVVDYPHEGSVFPPDFTAPTFLWHDANPASDAWRLEFRFADDGEPVRVISSGPPPAEGEIDPHAIGDTNKPYEGTEYQQSARSFTPEAGVWEEIKRRSVSSPVELVISGYAAAAPDTVLANGRVRISTSKDAVGAPIYYRDVPLMPGVGKDGVIAPIDPRALPRIKWRLRDVSRAESRVMLTGVPSCMNCHSFTQDGSTMALDVDGPSGDKGAYAITPIEKVTVIEKADVISWNDFQDKPEGHRTIGFLSRISPDGRHVVSTLNEDLYVSNFQDYRFLQVFFPTQGILAWHSRETGEIKALPGADDVRYVHCDVSWFPDGKDILFMRAPEFEPHPPGRKVAKYPNDPIEPRIRYDVYRMPFNEGKGGKPVPVKGASDNGASNSFPRVTPDGKWIIFTKCRNGMLMRPDGRLWIVPAEGGEAREMKCNTTLMNSWHSFSPNSRWMVFSSKVNTPYTQLFLTHIDDDGNDTPPILIPNSTAANRAANIPEFVNRPYDSFQAIDVPAVDHHRQLHEGIKLAKEGDFEAAAACFEKSMEAEPDFTRALANYGRALLELGRVKEARKILARTLELDPEFSFVYCVLGVSYMREGDEKRAESYYLRALDFDTKNQMAHYNLAVLKLDQRRMEEAAGHARTASKLDPCDANSSNLLGWILLQQGQVEDAAEEFRKALAHDAGHRLAQENLLAILRRRGPPDELVAHLKVMVETRPGEVPLALSLAWELSTRPQAELRDGKRAVELAEACLDSAGEKPEILDVLAAALAEAGRYPEAVKAAGRALELVKSGKGNVAPGLEQRLAGYREGRPVRQR